MASTHYIPNFDSDGSIVNHTLSDYAISGGPWQGIYEESAVQRFPVGTRLQIADRVFYYCKAAGTTATAMKAGHNSIADVGVNTAAAIHAAGETAITILDTATRAANYYQNGYLWVMNEVSGVFQMLKIKSSDAAAAADDQVVIHLYDPLPFAIPASTFVTVWPNPYSAVTFTNSTYQSMVCVPLIPVTSGYYFWGQTYGPCFGTAMSAVPGAAATDRDVYFNSDGALINGASLTTNGAQRAGYIITGTSSGAGDQFYMLQLAV
jgi:hypothetical protein